MSTPGFSDSRRTLNFFAILSLCLVLLVGNSPAQSFRGKILGTVTDQSGAVVQGASVAAKNVGTGIERTTTTDSDGNYSFSELPIGTYEVKISQGNFRPQTIKDVVVEVAGERRADASLSAGTEAIVNVAVQEQVETTSTTLGGTIQSRAVADLPVNGRDFTKFLVLVPGAAGDPSGATDSPGSFGLFSANGNRGRSNNYLLDGADMNDGYRNLPAINEAGVFGTPATILPLEGIQEVAVLSNFEAQYGRNSGSVVNIVTKSGTNAFHGALFEFLRNDKTDARNFFNQKTDPKTALRNNQFGASLGGKLVENRTFFFLNYEGQRERVGLNSTARIPDPLEIENALNGNGCNQTPNRPAGGGIMLNPVIAQLLARNPWGTPNRPLPLCDSSGSPNLFATTLASNNIDNFIGKIDHSFNENNQITGRYYYGKSEQSFPLALLGGNILPGYNTITPTRVDLVSISYLKIFSSTKVNEVRFGYNRYDQGFFPEDQAFDPGTIGLNTGVTREQDFGLPFIRITGDAVGSIASIGSNLSLPRARVDTNIHFIDNFSWKLNAHDTKMGYEFRRTDVNAFFDAGYRGRLDFATLEDFLQGNLSGGRSALGDSRRQTFQNSHTFYFQDNWRATHNLTLNLGVRWDYFGVIGEKNNLFSNFDPNLGLVMVGTNGSDKLYRSDWNNFSPRLGFAWDLNGRGKTVVRGGWGLFYDAFSQDFFTGQLPWNTFNPGPAYNPVGPSPILFSYSTVGQIQAGVPIFTDYTDSDVFAVDRNLQTPMIQNYNFNIQHELTRNVVMQAGYVGSLGRHLFRYRDINQPVNPAVSTARPFDNGPFAPSGGTFFYVNQLETTANSNYNALQTSLNLRSFMGFSGQVNYVWSHSIDDASDGQDYVTNAAQPDNSYNAKGERGNSNFDIRHRFVAALSYELPNFAKDHPRIGSGWQLNTIVTLRSGSPFHVTFFGDYNGTGEFFVRPDLVGDPYAGTTGPDQFLNLAAFKVPCTLVAGECDPSSYHFGSLGRNSLIGPAYRNVDFSLFKTTRLTERVNLQLRAEVFNILNHPNFASPLLPGFVVDAGEPDAAGLGQDYLRLGVTPDVGIGNPFLGGGGPRNFQFAARVTF